VTTYTIKIILNEVEAVNEDDAFNQAVEELNSMSPDCWAAEITIDSERGNER
jgi:hypothetical protein